MAESNRPENKLVAERRKKLAALRADGFAFPNTFRRTALAGQLHRVYDEHSNEAFEGAPVAVLVPVRPQLDQETRGGTILLARSSRRTTALPQRKDVLARRKKAMGKATLWRPVFTTALTSPTRTGLSSTAFSASGTFVQ